MPSFVGSHPQPNPEAGEPYLDVWPDRLVVRLVRRCSGWFLVIFFWLPLALVALNFCGIYNAGALIHTLHSAPPRKLAEIGINLSERGLAQVAWLLWLATIARGAGAIAFYRRRGLVVRSHTVGYSGDVLPTSRIHHRDERWCWRRGNELE
jgi:hypothetical protein